MIRSKLWKVVEHLISVHRLSEGASAILHFFALKMQIDASLNSFKLQNIVILRGYFAGLKIKNLLVINADNDTSNIWKVPMSLKFKVYSKMGKSMKQ